MKTRSFRLAVAQPFCRPGDIEGNLSRMEPLMWKAVDEGARLVLFSECGVTGYAADAPRVAVGDTAYERLRAMAGRHGATVVAGFLERDGERTFLSQGAFFPNGEVVRQRKARTGNVEAHVPGFAAGEDERRTFEVDGVRCAIAICADMGIPHLQDDLTEQGVQLLLLPTAGCGPRTMGYAEASLQDEEVFRRYLKDAESVVFSKDAIETCRRYGRAMASCNQMADDGVDYFHPGHSMIVDASGELAALIPGTFVFEHLRPRVAVGEIRVAERRTPPEAGTVGHSSR